MARMTMRHATTLPERAAPSLCAVLAGPRTKGFFRKPGVGGFVDSGPKTPTPSASNRSTPEWTLVDSRRPGRTGRSSVDQAVELAGVGAGDHARHLGRDLGELLLDVFVGVRPYAVAVRVVGAPHQALGAHVVDQLGADAVVLESGLALAAPV